MLVNVQLCQGTDIDFELAFLWKRIAQFVVQSVDSLNDQDVFFSKL